MILARRTFLFGAAAAIAASATPGLVSALQTTFTRVNLYNIFARRGIIDLQFSCSAESPDGMLRGSDHYVQWTFYRNHQAVISNGLNARAFVRWVAAPGEEICLKKRDVFRVDIEPALPNVNITIVSNVNPDKDPPWLISEAYRWENDKAVLQPGRDLVVLDFSLEKQIEALRSRNLS